MGFQHSRPNRGPRGIERRARPPQEQAPLCRVWMPGPFFKASAGRATGFKPNRGKGNAVPRVGLSAWAARTWAETRDDAVHAERFVGLPPLDVAISGLHPSCIDFSEGGEGTLDKVHLVIGAANPPIDRAQPHCSLRGTQDTGAAHSILVQCDIGVLANAPIMCLSASGSTPRMGGVGLCKNLAKTCGALEHPGPRELFEGLLVGVGVSFVTPEASLAFTSDLKSVGPRGDAWPCTEPSSVIKAAGAVNRRPSDGLAG